MSGCLSFHSCFMLLIWFSVYMTLSESVNPITCDTVVDAIQVHLCNSGTSEHSAAYRCDTANWAAGASSSPACIGCSSGVFFVDALEVTTGKYKRLFEVPPSRTSPAHTGVNGCSINPADSILYCFVMTSALYVARIDASTVSIVGKVGNGAISNGNNGVFDDDGSLFNFPYSSNTVLRHTKNLASRSDGDTSTLTWTRPNLKNSDPKHRS